MTTSRPHTRMPRISDSSDTREGRDFPFASNGIFGIFRTAFPAAPRTMSNLRLPKLLSLLGFLLLSLFSARAGIVNAVYNSATDVAVTSSGNYDATGLTVNFTLNFAPPVGTNLTVVRLTGLGTINGTFANLAQNQPVTLSYAGQLYSFVANYNGGPASNDLVLQWAEARAVTWGNNGNGQAGNGVPDSVNTLPVAVTSSGVLSGKTVIAMAAGRNHTLALCSDGTVAGWGLNTAGQIGSNGGASQSNVPVLVSTLGVLATKRVIAIAAGETHSLALCSDGTVAAWGSNTNGQLGTGGGTTGTPTAVNTSGALSGKRVVAIAAGQNHSMALLSTGAVATWGYNFYGQLGNKSNTTSPVPVLVSTGNALSGKIVAAIASGQLHCIALCSDGTLVTWGANADGQLGNNDTLPVNEPVAVTTAGTVLAAKTVTAVAAGGFHSIALCSDGTLATWGLNSNGQLGPISSSHYLPAAMSMTGALLGKTITTITAGAQHSLAFCSDGTLAAWGLNSTGQLGNGSTATTNVPQNVSTGTLTGGAKFQVPACGPNALHSLAITAAPYTPILLTTGTLISNGSFEAGFTNWTYSDINSPYSSVAFRTNGFSPGFGLFSTVATDGIRAATSGFGGFGPSVIRLSHDVAVTAAEPYVRFDWRAGWNMLDFSNFTLPRTFSVTIEPVGGGPVMQSTVILSAAPHTKNLDTGSQVGAVDLSAFIGTTVRVCFDLTVPESAFGPAFFQLDNVRTAALQPASVNPITLAATSSTLQGATMNGTVNANGLTTTVEFEYGPTTGYGSTIPATPPTVSGNADTGVSAPVSGLVGKTTYHYRVKTTNSSGVKYGADATFTTLPHAPGVSGLSSTSGNSSAALSAIVEPDESSTVVTFEYGPTTDYGSSTAAWESPISSVQLVHGQVSGLTSGVTYHYRVKAQNAGGITYSEDSIFAPFPSQPGDPSVSTLPPTMVSRSSATLNGSVNANGFSSEPDFQFGTTTNYNSNVFGAPTSVSGSTDTAIAGIRGNLSPGTTYHYRARAHGPNGYVYGPDVTFTTPAIGFPAASTDKVTGFTQTTAILRGYATANNGPEATVSFDYGLDANYGSTVTMPGFIGGQSLTPVQMEIPISGDNVTYHYRVKAKNNIGTTYGQDMTFTTPDSHEARIYDLTFDSGALSPAFNRDVLTYTMALPFETVGIALTPTASKGIASVTVNGVAVASGAAGDPIALHLGANVLNITVTSLDGQVQQTYTVTVTRAMPGAGNMDLSFNGTGQLWTDIGLSDDYASAVAVQSDGRIVVAGSAYSNFGNDFAVARYNPDGTPDTTFGTAGKVVTDLSGGPDQALGLALQSDGKIVLAGSSSNGGGTDFALVRYNADGSLDTTFGVSGKVTTLMGTGESAGANGVAVQTDGKIVVAGFAYNGGYKFALARYHGNTSTGTPGTLDTTFNGNGKLLASVGTSDDFANSIALQTDGKIVVGGQSYSGSTNDFAVARYETNGAPDTTFNGTGSLVTGIGASDDTITSVAVQGDGKIVAAGFAWNGSKNNFALARYTSTGALDTDFNSTGKVITAAASGENAITGMTLQSDGKIVVAGRSNNGAGFVCTVARYTTGGVLDTTFKGTGMTTVDLGNNYDVLGDQVGGVALQGDEKIVLAGSANQWADFAVARILADGPAIAVETAPNTSVFDGISTVAFPGALPGVASSITFTIRNTGTTDLTGLGITVDGSSDFTVTTSPVAPVSPFGGTTFIVRFLPASLGPKTAVLHIASNVAGGTQSYDITLTGSGLSVLENWRQQFLPNAAGTGDAADNADPFHTGVPNLAAFAFLGPGQSPALAHPGMLPQAQLSGANYAIGFTQPAGVSGVTYGAQWCPDLAIGDWQPVTDTGTGADHIFSVPIGLNTQIFMRLTVRSP